MIELAAVREDITAPARAVWRVLTDWAHPERLAPTILRTETTGAVRIVTSSRGLSIHEALLDCDRDAYLFRYEILDSGDMPFAGVTSYRCTARLTRRTDAITEIAWRSEGTLDGPPEPIRDFLTGLYRTANKRIAQEACREASLDHVLAGAVDRGVAPGLVGVIADAKSVLYARAHGVRAAGEPQAMTLDTVFWLASLTKLVTTVAAMQLVEAGRLALDEPVAALLPELADPQVLEGFDADDRPILRPARGAITLRHLLTHRSGLGYDLMSPRLMRTRGPAGPPPAMALASLRGPLLFDPGEGWAYGTGLDWTGLAIERCTDQTLDRYFADHIFAPLGMTATGFAPSERCAGVHLRQPEGQVVPIPSPMGQPGDWEFRSGGAGLFGTAGDYIRLLRMLLGGGALDGVRVLQASTVEAMWRDQAGGHPAGRVDTAIPALCLPYDPLPGQRGEWSLLGVRNPQDICGRRRAGGASWVGVAGTFFWIDPLAGVCGVLLGQLLPFADPALTEVREAFEAAVYTELDAPR